MTNNELWHAVLGELELTISKPNFTTWFRSTYIFSFDDGHMTVGVPNAFTKTWLEKKYHQAILKTLNTITSRGVKDVSYRVDFRVNASVSEPRSDGTQKDLNLDELKLGPEPVPVTDKYELNPRYSFESFVVGKGNELAHAAAQAVAARTGTAYNPLFIYGGVGLGKTHLIQAIGHFCLKKNKNFKILYVSCEKFTNDFIHAIRHGQSKDFKDRYRTVDLLIIDDVQFIASKKETQE
jgi:chromosomal replication initiator protein